MTQIISSSTPTARLIGRTTVAMVNRLAFWTYFPKRHQSSQQIAPRSKYCTPHAPIRSLKVMTVCLFHECTWTQSCNPNNSPSNVTEPTKMTGCRKSEIERFFFCGIRFVVDLRFLRRRALGEIKNWQEEGAGPRKNLRKCRPLRQQESRALLRRPYRRRQG